MMSHAVLYAVLCFEIVARWIKLCERKKEYHWSWPGFIGAITIAFTIPMAVLTFAFYKLIEWGAIPMIFGG